MAFLLRGLFIKTNRKLPMEASFDEQRIERYVRQPELLSAHERQAVKALLERNPTAREIADLFRVFYEEFAGLETERVPAVAAFLEQLFPPARIMVLHPYRPPVEAEPTVLAARTSDSSGRFEPLATLKPLDENVMVYLLWWNRAARRVRLYVNAHEMEDYAHALIIFPDRSLYLVTDEDGRCDATLAEEQVRADWEAAQATLHRQLAACVLRAEGLSGVPYIERLPSGYDVTCSYEGKTLTVTVHSGEEDLALPTLAVLEMTGGTVVVQLRKGTGTVSLEELTDHVNLRLYP